MTETIRSLPVESLLLDPMNPRLPEDQRGGAQPQLLAYLFDTAVLEELASSIATNGFFPHEPLIVLEADEDGQHIVVEGNRRYAALAILLQLPVAEEAGLAFPDRPLDRRQRTALRQAPCYVVADRQEVRTFLGFRHIGGVQRWSPEAKARYLLQEVEQAVADGAKQPFRDVARQVGSNAQGVRNPYLALRVLLQARDEFGLDIHYVQYQRFGVWNRLMNSADLRSYIGLDGTSDYHQIGESLKALDAERLDEVLNHLTPPPGRRKAVLNDSRDVTVYAAILANPAARQVLHEYDDLQLARQIVEQASIPQRIEGLAREVRQLTQEIHRVDATVELSAATEDLSGVVGTLRAAVRARVDD